MANTLKLEIITPTEKAFSDDVEMVTLPGVDGELGIFPEHVPLMTHLMPGEIIVRKAGQDLFLAIGEGFVEVTGDHITIISDMAIQAENIDEAKVEEARRRAEARLSEKLSDEDAALVNATLVRAAVQLRVKKHKTTR
jgi:F-type H+-transporting ATPase subunit epsilon